MVRSNLSRERRRSRESNLAPISICGRVCKSRSRTGIRSVDFSLVDVTPPSWPGRVASRSIDRVTLFLACAAGALARVVFDVTPVSHQGPGLLAGLVTAAGIFFVAAPVFVVIRKRSGQDLVTNAVLAAAAGIYAKAAFTVIRLAEHWFDNAGDFHPFATDLAYYGAALPLIIGVVWLTVLAAFAFCQATWQTRWWTLPAAWRWTVIFTDRGLGAFIGAFAGTWLSFIPGCRTQGDLLTLACLGFPVVFEFFGRMAPGLNVQLVKALPGGLTIAEERRWVCQELGVECDDPHPHQLVYVSAAVLADSPIVLARVATSGSSQWIACGGHITWHKQAWQIPVAVLAALRPDISPLLGLPPGWIATSHPPCVTYEPDVGRRVAGSMSRCRIHEFPKGLLHRPQSILERP